MAKRNGQESVSPQEAQLTAGYAIRLLRMMRNKTLSDLAKDAKISIAFLSLIESGQRSPSVDCMERVSLALNIPKNLLLMCESAELQSTDPQLNKIREIITRHHSLLKELRETCSHRKNNRP